MQIQWYPGHMHKAAREIRQRLPTIDLIIEVLDARIPFSSENPMIHALRGDKPCIKVLAKSDLADPGKTAEWQAYLERERGVGTLAVSTEAPERMRQLTSLSRRLAGRRGDDPRPVNALIMGIPNVGKSTLINILAGRPVARTGNEPAVTKAQQRIELDERLVLYDTPGMLWPNVENRNSGYRLAATGAVKETAMEYEDVAWFIADFLLREYPGRLLARYGLDELPEGENALLDAIGRRRGCLMAGGHVDFDKASRLLLTDLRGGRLGPLTLETPETMERELVALERIRAEKAARREARKAARKKKGKSKKRSR